MRALPGMKPPVALASSTRATTQTRRFFFPFAEFSPEWQAMLWAVSHRRAVRFIDWPAGIHLHRLLLEKQSENRRRRTCVR